MNKYFSAESIIKALTKKGWIFSPPILWKNGEWYCGTKEIESEYHYDLSLNQLAENKRSNNIHFFGIIKKPFTPSIKLLTPLAIVFFKKELGDNWENQLERIEYKKDKNKEVE